MSLSILEKIFHFVKMHFKMLKAVAESKERLDATLDKQESIVEKNERDSAVVQKAEMR